MFFCIYIIYLTKKLIKYKRHATILFSQTAETVRKKKIKLSG